MKWSDEVRRREFGCEFRWHVARIVQEFETTHQDRMPGEKGSDDGKIEQICKSLCEKNQGKHLKSDVVRGGAVDCALLVASGDAITLNGTPVVTASPAIT